jgi:hypothetical protein
MRFGLSGKRRLRGARYGEVDGKKKAREERNGWTERRRGDGKVRNKKHHKKHEGGSGISQGISLRGSSSATGHRKE